MRMRWACILGMLMGCEPGSVSPDDGPADARITADAWAWNCDFSGEQWVGAKHFFVDLQHAPQLIEPRPLPEVGQCEVWGSTFARDDLLGGTNFTDVDGFMKWALVDGGAADRVTSGTFQPSATGYWHSDAYDDHHTCHTFESVMSSGVEVQNAPSLVGTSTPAPGELNWVELDVPTLDGIPFGTSFNASWTASGWQDQFIILNRARSGFTVESIVCNVTGENQFSVDDSFWSLANEATGSDESAFFVAFRNLDVQRSDSGMNVETLTRALWTVSVTE